MYKYYLLSRFYNPSQNTYLDFKIKYNIKRKFEIPNKLARI